MKSKKIYKIKGMHCASCAMLIEGELEDRKINGVCSYAKQTVEVVGTINDDIDKKVKEAVEGAGYSLSE